MNRKNFISTLGILGLASMNLKSFASNFEESTAVMPAFFCAHGSPMNALDNNDFTLSLASIGRSLPKPKAVLCISAHWLTKGTFVNASEQPRMIYDMSGFPKELYEVEYKALGSPNLAEGIAKSNELIQIDTEWGFDHGNWSIMKWLFPKADIPVFQMSLDYNKPMEYHYKLAQELQYLRTKGIMIIGSGNITHNLRIFNPDPNSSLIADWAEEFDNKVKKAIDSKDHNTLLNYKNIGNAAQLAVPEPSHYIPLIYLAGLQNSNDLVDHVFEGFQHETFSMRCIKINQS